MQPALHQALNSHETCQLSHPDVVSPVRPRRKQVCHANRTTRDDRHFLLWQKTHACVDAVPGGEGARLDAEFAVKAIKDLYWPAGDDMSQTTPVSDG